MLAGCSSPGKKIDSHPAHRSAVIQPDYSGIEIPPNIAPLNFFIKEAGDNYYVQIHSKEGKSIQIESETGSMQIQADEWKQLLAQNVGQELIFEIYVKGRNGEWLKFNPIVNHIADEPIDKFLAYRKLGPLYNLYKKMGIYQRNLETFDEKPILLNRQTGDNCMNCHNFWNHGTERWLLHLRGGPGTSMLLTIDGKIKKVDTKTQFNGPTAYPAWHPSGELIAFSVSKLVLFFHEAGECRDVLDKESDIVIYDISKNTITTAPQIASPNRMEIWPAWSPDGKYLYFCSAPNSKTFEDSTVVGGFAYDRIKYDLMRVAYDPKNRTWGKLDTVVSSNEIGLSITEPRVSPDGRFVLFTAAKYSQFPIYLPSADLYLLDCKTGKWKKLEINSDQADTFHSWSWNSRWIVFSSKRLDGTFTRPFFSHIDSSGTPSKPFVLPQNDPRFYESFIDVYNAPELTNEAISVSPQDLAKAAYSEEDALKAKLDPNVIMMKNAMEKKPVPDGQDKSKQKEMKH